MQDVKAVKWNPGIEYELEDVQQCYNMTMGDSGELLVWVKTQSNNELRAQAYDQGGELQYALLCPSKCKHHGRPNIKVVDQTLAEVTIDGESQIALSCWECQRIYLWSRHTDKWSVAWKPLTKWLGIKKVDGQPTPATMIKGKPGQLIAGNGEFMGGMIKVNKNLGLKEEKTVGIFDTTQVPFRLAVQQIKPDLNHPMITMSLHDMCYCDLPGVGGAIAIVGSGGLLSMHSLENGKLLWTVGDRDARRGWEKSKVAGTKWSPVGVCSDNRGRLYVADSGRDYGEDSGPGKAARIVVFSAASGSLLQVVLGNGQWEGSQEKNDFRYIAQPGITVYGPDIKYNDEGVSGTVLQDFKEKQLGQLERIRWDEHTQSIIINQDETKISYFQIEF